MMLENKITIYVGDCGVYLAKIAGSDGHLLDCNNYREFLSTRSPGTYYTSHPDLGKITDNETPLYQVLNIADDIRYFPPDNWSDDDGTFRWTNTKYLTEYLLRSINDEKNNVSGLPDSYSHVCDKYLGLEDHRNTDDPCIFASGCSITYGVGVEKQQTFGHLVSKHVKKKLVMLAKPGSGLEFQKDQILRSDIRSGDIVIWGLTYELRRPEWVGMGVETKDLSHHTFEETGIYLSVTSIFQVVNFCRKIGARLILVPIISSDTLHLGLTHLPEFLNLPYLHHAMFIDRGSDGSHPGAKQHKVWADHIIKRILLK